MTRTVFPRLLLALATILVAASGATLAGNCLTAQVPFPVVLPDGSVHEAGQLELCVERRLNPVIDIHEIAVGGNNVGLYHGRAISSESSSMRPYLIFHRSAAGELILVGYARPPKRKGMQGTTVLMAEQKQLDVLIAEGEHRALTQDIALTAGAPQHEDPVVLVAAR